MQEKNLMHGFLLHGLNNARKSLQEPIKAQIRAQKPHKTAFLHQNQTKKRKMFRNIRQNQTKKPKRIKIRSTQVNK